MTDTQPDNIPHDAWAGNYADLQENVPLYSTCTCGDFKSHEDDFYQAWSWGGVPTNPFPEDK